MKEMPTDPVRTHVSSDTEDSNNEKITTNGKMPLKEKLLNIAVAVFLSFTMMICIYQINSYIQLDNMNLSKFPFLDLLILILCFKYLRVYVKKLHELVGWHGFKQFFKKFKKK